jgi:hypothetical protein
MKVCIKYSKKLFKDKQIKIIKDFVKLLNKIMPLSEEINLFFLDKRVGKMTTGSYKHNIHTIKVLVKNRIMSDILRTLSHEWGHAFDNEHINFKDRRDVGGDSENFANAISGAITKHYIKKHPELEDTIFE